MIRQPSKNQEDVRLIYDMINRHEAFARDMVTVSMDRLESKKTVILGTMLIKRGDRSVHVLAMMDRHGTSENPTYSRLRYTISVVNLGTRVIRDMQRSNRVIVASIIESVQALLEKAMVQDPVVSALMAIPGFHSTRITSHGRMVLGNDAFWRHVTMMRPPPGFEE